VPEQRFKNRIPAAYDNPDPSPKIIARPGANALNGLENRRDIRGTTKEPAFLLALYFHAVI
jgi:hypothetical protein